MTTENQPGSDELMQELGSETGQPRLLRTGGLWSSNVCGAAVAGAGARILMLSVMSIVIWMNPTRQNTLFGATLALALL